MDLDHTSRGCKGHLRHTTTPTKSLPYLLGALLLILPSPHLLLGPSHLNIMPNKPLIHFNPYAQPQPQWNASHQGWRPQYNSTLTLLPPPPSQPQGLPFAPPRQPQMPTQPNPNPNNRQA